MWCHDGQSSKMQWRAQSLTDCVTLRNRTMWLGGHPASRNCSVVNSMTSCTSCTLSRASSLLRSWRPCCPSHVSTSLKVMAKRGGDPISNVVGVKLVCSVRAGSCCGVLRQYVGWSSIGSCKVLVNDQTCHGSHPELSSTRALIGKSSSDVTASKWSLSSWEGGPSFYDMFHSMFWIVDVHVATLFKSNSHASDFVTWWCS